MTNKQKFENFTLKVPFAIDFLGLDSVEQVVEEAFIKEPKRGRKSKAF
jgi:hypothetical protein